jgi:hypothetical protein
MCGSCLSPSAVFTSGPDAPGEWVSAGRAAVGGAASQDGGERWRR